jgi:hypothetical protein
MSQCSLRPHTAVSEPQCLFQGAYTQTPRVLASRHAFRRPTTHFRNQPLVFAPQCPVHLPRLYTACFHALAPSTASFSHPSYVLAPHHALCHPTAHINVTVLTETQHRRFRAQGSFQSPCTHPPCVLASHHASQLPIMHFGNQALVLTPGCPLPPPATPHRLFRCSSTLHCAIWHPTARGNLQAPPSDFLQLFGASTARIEAPALACASHHPIRALVFVSKPLHPPTTRFSVSPRISTSHHACWHPTACFDVPMPTPASRDSTPLVAMH